MTIPQKFIPFDAACRLRSLQQGSLNIGNTLQNKTALYNLCVTEANSPTTGFAKWRGGNNVAKDHSNLRVIARLVPGYTPPIGTGYVAVPGGGGSGLPVAVSMTAGGPTTAGFTFLDGGANFSGSGWTGFAADTASTPFGSLSGSPTINGNAIFGILEANASTFGVVLQGILTKSAFTKVQFTDTGGAQTWLTASSTFTTGTGASTWVWATGANGKFNNGTVYTINFS